MSLYAVIEGAILLRLADRLQGVRVESFPDDANELGKATPVRRVLVGYQSSNFEVIAESPELVIKETLVFEITVGVKGLRSHAGVYVLLQEIRRALTGFLPVQSPNARKMRPTGFSYKGLEDGIWYYSATFTFEITYGEMESPSSPGSPEFSEISLPVEPVVLPSEITILTGIWRSQVDRLLIDPALDNRFSVAVGGADDHP